MPTVSPSSRYGSLSWIVQNSLVNKPIKLKESIRQYLIITANYWAFTLTDGALRMLVVLYFYGLGYSPLQIAMLFVLYEFFGVVTNLVGGWLGTKFGLNKTMNVGLFLQIIALTMLLVPTYWLSVAWVMGAQALSGIAKDLNKMSAKSAIKSLVPQQAQTQLYRWVAVLTGSKNALKGAGFFLGGALLSILEFRGAIVVLIAGLVLVWSFSIYALKQDLGKGKNKPKFRDIFSKSRSVNILSAARLFLFGARDLWFVVALPVYLASVLGWDHWYVGSFLAAWIIFYGVIQSISPAITGMKSEQGPRQIHAVLWAVVLALVPALIGLSFVFDWHSNIVLVVGLFVFGGLFAVNSAMHSYLILRYADERGVSLDVGFYYMANAMGRLLGTVVSGWLYQSYGLLMCLWTSTACLVLASLISLIPFEKITTESVGT